LEVRRVDEVESSVRRLLGAGERMALDIKMSGMAGKHQWDRETQAG
jgi:hypothetical protein